VISYPKQTMRESAGNMKVAILAFGHSDNVLCLAQNLSKYVNVTLIFITAGERFTRSIFDWDISQLPYGLTMDSSILCDFIDKRIQKYIGSSVNIGIARTPTRKILKDWKRENFRYSKIVARYLNKNSFDVIHFNGASGLQLYFHYFLRAIPKVCTIHDYLPHTGESTYRHKLIDILLNKFYTKLDCEFIQHYQFLSKEFTDFYNIEPKRVHTVYCGPLEVYREYMNEIVTEESHTILFFGRISPYKGLEYLIKAFPTIKKAVPNARLIIAGKGKIWFTLENDSRCEIRNYHIANEELVRLIRKASVVVTPYTDATHSAVIMTAYAFHKPVVASAVGGIPEVVEDGVTGRLVPARNPRALADVVIDVLLNQEKREQMKKNIEKECLEGKLSWDNTAKKTIEVYRKAIDTYKA